MNRLQMRMLALGMMLALPLVAAAQPPAPQQQPSPDARDLKTVGPATKNAPVTIPRSYALVIGVAKYKNLPESAQLAFPNRDAEDMYTTLISAEGGQFPAENVHKLINEKATIANIRQELEQWLPSVTKDDDRVVMDLFRQGRLILRRMTWIFTRLPRRLIPWMTWARTLAERSRASGRCW